MCQTLLWSYDIQAQMRKAVQNASNQDQVNDLKTDGSKVVENIPQEPVLDEQNPKKQNDVNFDNVDMDQNTKIDHNNFPERNIIVPESQVVINTDNSSIAKNLSEMPKVQALPELSNIFQSRIMMPIINHTAVNLVEDKGNLTAINAGVENKTVSVNEETEKSVAEKDVNKKVELVKDAGKRLEPVKDEVKNQKPVQDVERNSEAVNDAEKKVKTVKNAFTILEKAPTTDVASEDAINAKNKISNPQDVVTDSEVPKKAQENELDGANFDEEMPKGADVGNALPIPGTEKDSQKPIEMATSMSEKVVDSTPKSTSTTIEVLSDRTMDEDPDDREPDQDYKNSLNELKARKPVVKSSVVSEVVKPSIDMQDNYDMLLTRNNFGRGQEDTPLIASFPEQEDSHFFFYFLSIVLILMAGYLLVHNKQKIIALIIEGRHERRRRSHGAAYKKLDTK